MKLLSDFTIEGSFQEKLEIQNVNHQEIVAEGKGNLILSNVYGNIVLHHICVRALIVTGFAQLYGKSSISNVRAIEFRIERVKIHNQLIIDKCNLEKARVGPFIDDNAGRLIIKETKRIGNAHILLDTINDISISDTNFEKLTLSGNHHKKLIIENAQTDWLQFHSVFNDGVLSLNSIWISKNGRLEIKSSNLGKADFLKCNFSKAVLDFENSKIAEIFSSATTFPRKPATKTREAYSQAQLAYGQLAASFARQGDTVRTYTYQSYEIDAHFKNTSPWSSDFFTWFNLALNKISNNFGRWWALGILFTFGVGWLFFYSLILRTKEVTVAFNIVPDWPLVISFLRFMNPLRSFDTEALFKINDYPYLTLTGGAYVIDFVGRIFIAYGFYQTIQAFRRFGRK